MSKKPTETDWDFGTFKPYWQCQSCGYKDHKKDMPIDREKYYASPKPHKCKKCKSYDMIPIGL